MKEEQDQIKGPDVLPNLSVSFLATCIANGVTEAQPIALLEISRLISGLWAGNQGSSAGALPGARGFTHGCSGGGMRPLCHLCAPISLEGPRRKCGTN